MGVREGRKAESQDEKLGREELKPSVGLVVVLVKPGGVKDSPSWRL